MRQKCLPPGANSYCDLSDPNKSNSIPKTTLYVGNSCIFSAPKGDDRNIKQIIVKPIGTFRVYSTKYRKCLTSQVQTTSKVPTET